MPPTDRLNIHMKLKWPRTSQLAIYFSSGATSRQAGELAKALLICRRSERLCIKPFSACLLFLKSRVHPGKSPPHAQQHTPQPLAQPTPPQPSRSRSRRSGDLWIKPFSSCLLFLKSRVHPGTSHATCTAAHLCGCDTQKG
jgi:hypothetical protein